MISVSLSAGPAAAECVFAKIGEMTVDTSKGAPRIQIEANGQKRWVLLVTGSHRSTLRTRDIEALGGKVTGESSLVRMTAKGQETLRYALVPNVVMGGAFRLPSFEVLVDDSDDEALDGVAGYLGSDILAAADVEFDLANNRAAFFKPKDCSKSSLGYWGGAISETPMANVLASDKALSISNIAFRPRVTLNGKPVTAELNSTFSATTVDSKLATRLGLKPGSPEMKRVQATGPTPVWAAKFTEFAIGGEQIKNPTFVLREMYRGIDYTPTGSVLRTAVDGLPEMILGLDFMRSHRILVSNSQQKMYFSYNGGPVFKAPSTIP